MPCIDDKTTASHRPVIFMPAFLLLQTIAGAAIGNGHNEPEETPANKVAVQAAIDLVVGVPFRLLGEPDVSPFHGELHMSWTQGTKQVLVMCFPNRAPLIHHYMRLPGRPSEHNIEAASSDRLAHWLEWLRA